ncbi:MAG: glycosyltransferase [Chitinivibrionia bacterium]|nr:glycosyltransferase [Chitinivibrionia bacterium]
MSIIIPVWNGELFVGNILSQLTEQNLKDVEVIVVNDGSTDNTESVVLKYAKRNSNIKLISLDKNSGVSVARNAGIENSNGKHVWFLDADDAIPNNVINILRDAINDKTADVFLFSFKDDSCIEWVNDNQCMAAKEFLIKVIGCRIRFHLCSVIFNKNFLVREKLRFVVGRKLGQDIEFCMKAFASSDESYSSSSVIYFYICRDDSATQGGKRYIGERIEMEMENLLEQKKYISERHQTLEKYINYYVLQKYFGFILQYIKQKQKDKNTTDILIKHKYLFAKPLAFYFPKTIVFWVLRFLPMKLVFNVFGKN